MLYIISTVKALINNLRFKPNTDVLDKEWVITACYTLWPNEERFGTVGLQGIPIELAKPRKLVNKHRLPSCLKFCLETLNQQL
jgi:hypothetical protein